MNNQLEHYLRILDMMITGHSELRDRYSNYALFLDILILSLSVLICSTTFLDPEILTIIQISPQEARIIIGLASISIFMLSLISLRVDWKQRAEKHYQVAETFAGLKLKCRSAINSGQDLHRDESLCHECALVLERAPVKIPEKEFLRLKALHLRKIELSKLLDKHPGSNVLFLRMILFFRLFRGGGGTTDAR